MCERTELDGSEAMQDAKVRDHWEFIAFCWVMLPFWIAFWCWADRL